MTQMDKFTKPKQEKKNRNRFTDMDLWLPAGDEGSDWEPGISRCKLLHAGWMHNKVLLDSTGN